ncbi:NUDIX domain-containing protein, partial [Actinophytocola sp.]|uniref:NUDIX domain-containing protein n=1 Tax=Actinophytocola sp. TaxID=1872138 RepID=UPI0039C86E79
MDEDPVGAIRREVEEETGYRMSTVEPLTACIPWPVPLPNAINCSWPRRRGVGLAGAGAGSPDRWRGVGRGLAGRAGVLSCDSVMRSRDRVRNDGCAA